jgi:hypothetical protein
MEKFTLAWTVFFDFVNKDRNVAIYLHKLCFTWFLFGNKPDRNGGEFFITRAEIAKQTTLSTKEQRTALEKLKKMDFVQTYRKGAHQTLWYRLNIIKINELLVAAGYNPLKTLFLPPGGQPPLPLEGQPIPLDTSLESLKERELLRNSLPAEPVASPQPLESASMKKKSPPESVDLAEVLADPPVRRAKRQVSVAQQTVRRAYSEVRQPHVDFMPAVADAWRDIVTNIESMGKKPGIIALSRWQQTILDYQAKHGTKNTVAWLNRLIEKNAEWIYPIDADDLKFKPKTKPKYESRDNVIDIYQNLT